MTSNENNAHPHENTDANNADNENIVDNNKSNEGNEELNLSQSTGIEHLVDSEDDDEDFANDVVLDAQDNRGLIEQGDDVLNWEVTGLYKDNGKLHPARYLKKNPPILTIKDDTGVEANFVLTKNLSYQLRYAVDSVYKGYFNVESDGINDDKTESKIKKWFPMVLIVVAVAIIYIVSIAF